MRTLALIGPNVLWLLFGWLLAAVAAGYLSERKGYGDRPGLAAGLILPLLSLVPLLLIPAREGSAWKAQGAFGGGGGAAVSTRPAFGGGGDVGGPSVSGNAPGAVPALVLGILGLVLLTPLAPFAVWQGRKAKEAVDASRGRYGGGGLAQAGFVLGCIGCVFLVLQLIYVFTLL